MMLLNQLIQRFERVALKNSMPMTSGQRGRAARLLISRKPLLKRTDVHSVKRGDLRLSPLAVQVRRDGAFSSLFSCNSHAEYRSEPSRFFNR